MVGLLRDEILYILHHGYRFNEHVKKDAAVKNSMTELAIQLPEREPASNVHLFT
jgi:hypothetical protein